MPAVFIQHSRQNQPRIRSRRRRKVGLWRRPRKIEAGVATAVVAAGTG